MTVSKRVYINGRFLTKNATGVQKYALGLCKQLQIMNIDYLIIAPNGYYDNYGLQIKKTIFGGGFLWEQLFLPFYLWLHKGGILINLCNTAPLIYKNQLVTVHDLAFEKNKKWFHAFFSIWYSFLIPHLCKRAKGVITVSEFIKNEIIETYGICSDKITVIPNSIPDMVYEEERPFQFRYIFLTGVYNPRKNNLFVINLINELSKMDYHIVAVGDDAGIYNKLSFTQDNKLHILKYTDDRLYYTLLKHAECLIYPSEYEGFGIPVLEGLVLGVPVLLPDMTFYHEIFGDLPLYYKQGDAESLLNKLKEINIYKTEVKDINILKNKYNFTASANMLQNLINHKTK